MSTVTPPPVESTPTNDSSFVLVAMLLEEQRAMTAVERFGLFEETVDPGEPSQARYYRSLLPATPPGPGQQYSFHVDLDACSGCKACVVACHTMNGLEEEESWRQVGTVTLESGPSRLQHVTTACHHCQDPGCLAGCPVKAYDKDPLTGIVRHLDDQCIGCKYCTMMCPYEVPRYSQRLGIVRKCDMCHQRLSVGEAPACVQSCPNEAIAIGLVDVDDTTVAVPHRLAPGAPLSTITKPTTVYGSKTIGSDGHGVEFPISARAQDADVDSVSESHWPLAIMLVATQIAVGTLMVERLVALFHWASGTPISSDVTRWTSLFALGIAAAGLNLAPLHLGKPLRAWRVFLGWKTSWLSREAVILGQFAALLAAANVLLWLPQFRSHIPAVADAIPGWAGPLCLSLSIPLGIAGLISSAMIYIATGRTLWRTGRTGIRFLGTTLIGGSSATAAILWCCRAPELSVCYVLLMVVIGLTLKLDWEHRVLLGDPGPADDTYDVRSRRLVQRDLGPFKQVRLGGAAIGLVLSAGTIVVMWFLPVELTLVTAILAAISITVGEICERLLYFSSVVYDRMPGILK